MVEDPGTKVAWSEVGRVGALLAKSRKLEACRLIPSPLPPPPSCLHAKVTIAPLVAIHNSFPSDLVVWSSCSPNGEDQTERIVPGMGTVTPLVDFQDSKWYHLRFGMRLVGSMRNNIVMVYNCFTEQGDQGYQR